MNLFQIPISTTKPEKPPTKFKIVVDAPDASFEREFTSIKALRQYQRRNPELKAACYTFHNDQWEPFTIYGSQVLPKSVLENLLNSLNKNLCAFAPLRETNPELCVKPNLIDAPEASTTK